MTYTEYANGQIILTGVSSENPFTYNKTTNSYGSGSSGSSSDITITVQYVGEGNNSGRFTLKNIVYSIVNGGYDVIHSAGTPSATGYFSYNSSQTVIVYNESSSSPAKIKYALEYEFYDVETMPGAVRTAILLFQLRNNSVTISVTDTT